MGIEIVEELKTVKRRVYRCDECNKIVDMLYPCTICGRLLCFESKCYVFDTRQTGDYPDKYCRHCWNIGQPYLKRMVLLQDRCDAEIEELEETWKHNEVNSERITNVQDE